MKEELLKRQSDAKKEPKTRPLPKSAFTAHENHEEKRKEKPKKAPEEEIFVVSDDEVIEFVPKNSKSNKDEFEFPGDEEEEEILKGHESDIQSDSESEEEKDVLASTIESCKNISDKMCKLLEEHKQVERVDFPRLMFSEKRKNYRSSDGVQEKVESISANRPKLAL